MEKKIEKLLKKRERLLQNLASLQLIMHGSYVERYSTCVRKNCACHRGDKHGPRSYIVIYRDARQRQIYVPQEQVDVVQRGLQQNEQAAELLRQITDVNLALMRAGALQGTIRPMPKGGK